MGVVGLAYGQGHGGELGADGVPREGALEAGRVDARGVQGGMEAVEDVRHGDEGSGLQ